MTNIMLKSIFLSTGVRVEGNLRDDFYLEQRVLEEYKTIWDSLSRKGILKHLPDHRLTESRWSER